MRVLVEVSWGIGNMVQGTPLCSALKSLGHDVDLFIHSRKLAEVVAPLFEGWDALGSVFVKSSDIDYAAYDIGVCCFGERRTAKRLPPGFCIDFGFYNLHGRNETELNLSPAVRLGYSGPTPASHVMLAKRDFELKPGTLVLHAGCDPTNAIKRWPHWSEICKRLQANGNEVVIVGTDSDRSDDGWESAYRNEFNLPLNELSALLNQATAYCGNDSGVGHIAAAVGLPGVVLFGPSDPVKNTPNSKVLTALVAEAKPGETRQMTEGKSVPVDRLTVDEVWAAIRGVLENPARDPARVVPEAPAEPVQPDVKTLPDAPAGETTEGLEDYLQTICTRNAAKLISGEARTSVVSQGKRETGQVHLRLSELWRQKSGSEAKRQAWYHAEAAVRSGMWLRGAMAKVKARRKA